MTDPEVVVTPVDSTDERDELRTLLVEYHEWMSEYEDRYDPAAELAEDLGSLAEEHESWAWTARFDETLAGCVLLYGVADDLAEFKRLWTRPTHRGNGIGRALTRIVVDTARTQGYETLGLTTPPWSETAQALYESMGFERTPPYPETRLPDQYHEDAIFMQLDLTDDEQ